MKTVIITGTSRGIGRATAEKFLNEGYFVIGTSQTGTCPITHKNFLACALEITSKESRELCAQKIIQEKKNIDILINNAGIFHKKDDGEIPNTEALEQTFAVNIIGLIAFSELIIPHINKHGEIINISSRRGSLEDPHKDALYTAYSMSKAALNMYTRKLACRLGDAITISSIHPGSVKTDLNPDGKISPEEAASDIFALVLQQKETGQFWYKGKQFPW